MEDVRLGRKTASAVISPLCLNGEVVQVLPADPDRVSFTLFPTSDGYTYAVGAAAAGQILAFIPMAATMRPVTFTIQEHGRWVTMPVYVTQSVGDVNITLAFSTLGNQ